MSISATSGTGVHQDTTGDRRHAITAMSVTKIYGDGDTAVRALHEVDIAFEAGRFSAIMGPSGSGKSTLMHCLAGLDTVTSGRIWLGSTELTELGDHALTLLRRERVGFVFQSFNLLPMLTARQNIELPLELAGARVDRAWLDELADTLGIADRLGHLPSQMSGGQQQRVAIARALITRPDVVFADEPTGNLDSRAGAQVLDFLRRSARELGQTVVMVTHDPVAASYAQRVVLLADGGLAGEIIDPTAERVMTALDQLRTSADGEVER
ncbi:ABC transporter ATP-binding protein [Phytoactinopolyspora halotolerans]|uniref:ABC transporter ATP-binding protein n=1 Tax=Phytoactinopolyspora halotolerans TaxID=1981512 RepID=A0A6L9S1W7_9ACTN|nr:ABC transporter ATP-binding protein [Phytoactinopolyspora halotolerans]NED98800.1 ABC transporter ATP-binding protein [Phytoactinopolyspora halotolerans]